jgi:2'-5' RNA ligase
MDTVLQLYLDDATDRFVRDLWQRLQAADLPSPLLERGATPHITLAFGAATQTEVLVRSLSRAMQTQPTFGLTFVSLATFANEKGVLFLAPVVNETLLHFHNAMSSAFKQECRQIEKPCAERVALGGHTRTFGQ